MAEKKNEREIVEEGSGGAIVIPSKLQFPWRLFGGYNSMSAEDRNRVTKLWREDPRTVVLTVREAFKVN